MNELVASDRAQGLLRGLDVEIPDDVSLGANVILYSGTKLGNGCHIEHGAIIGRTSRSGVGSAAQQAVALPTILGNRTIVGSFAIVCSGVITGEDAFIGEHAFVREGARIGARACIGFSTTLGHHCVVGDETRIQGFCALRNAIIEDNCVIGPYVGILTSSFKRGDAGPGAAVTIRRGSQIGSSVQIMPGVFIGPHATVAVASVVTRDVPPHVVAGGTPARIIKRQDPIDRDGSMKLIRG